MIIAHYAHRLPADYDVGIIRKRAAARGHLFDGIPELYFKGFLLRERGRYGAIANEYSSLYLWRKDDGFRNFLVDGRTKSVTDSFGRPQIETRFVLDARKGTARDARFVYKEEIDIPLDADLTPAFAAEIARNREVARETGVVAATVGVDAQNWKFTRVLLSEREPVAGEQAYQVLYLAQTVFDELPSAQSRAAVATPELVS
jgi:Domain of unknown function (DUF4865)